MSRNSVPGSQRKPISRLRVWKWGLVVGLILLMVLFLLTCGSIGGGVRSISDKALREYSGDRVTVLMAFVESEEQGFRDRNRAIWALGQLGDGRALPILEKYYAGGSLEKREDLSRELSQHELKKAIHLCEGAVNISAVVWRHGALATR
jgi:hypothetical protein